jgi:hypothetical protein
MSTSPNVASSGQFAANRANAARSTGPTSAEGKARSAQNARKHGFFAAAYSIVRFEDAQEVANLREDAMNFYQPVNSQETFAVEHIALAQQAMLRIIRLEAGLFMACMNEAIGQSHPPPVELDRFALPDVQLTHTQHRNLLLGDGFQRSAAKSNGLSLCLRYAAQAERHYRRAIDDFNRLKALRPDPTVADPSGADLLVCVPRDHNPPPQPNPTAPATFDETNPFPPEPEQTEALPDPAPPLSDPYPEPVPPAPPLSTIRHLPRCGCPICHPET